MPKKKSNEQFIVELEKANNSIEPIEEYKNAVTPIMCRCKKCGYEWLGTPNNLLRKEGCPRCSGNMRLSTDEFINQMAVINPEITITGKYINNKTKISFVCRKCGRKGQAIPSSLKKGHGCKYCARSRNVDSIKHTNEWFLKELSKRNPGVVPLDPYCIINQKIRYKCACGREDIATPGSLLKGRKCTECQRNARQTTTKSQEDFIKELNEVNPQIIPLEPYQGIYKKILCECKICGNEWETSPHQLLIGRGCQKCKRRWQTSFPEQALLYYLKPLYSDIECSYKKGFGNSELDLFIPSLMIGIEYDGMRWHKGRVEVEQRKYELCKAQNIFLIRMRESIEGVELEKICDHWIETKYGREKKTEALDVSITELILYLGNSMSDDYVNTDRDRLNIQSSYYSEIGDRSLESIAPEIAKEWYQPKNGKIKPSMVRAGTNDMFYWKCWVCGFVYPATVYTRISGHGCPKCAGVMNKSHEAFLEEAKKANPNIIVLSEYTNATTKVCVQCMKCGFVGMVSPRTILKGGGCRVCNNKKAGLEKTIKQEDFIEDIKDKHPDIEVLGEYTGSHKRIRCHCKKCGYEWNPIAGSLRNGKVGCPNCAGNRRRRVLCIETGMEYESMGQAEKDTGINHSSISQCCKGLSKTAGGYHWKYYKE